MPTLWDIYRMLASDALSMVFMLIISTILALGTCFISIFYRQ